MPPAPRTLFEKIWERHKVVERDDGHTLLYIDRHYIHDGSRRAFEMLAEKGLKLRRPDRTFGTPDHYVPTSTRDIAAIADPEARAMVDSIERNAVEHGVKVFGIRDPRQGIVHVVGPEQGLTQPGLTIVCGDSHTSTHGALGALAFGIGASEVGHVMATQALWQRRPRTMRIQVDGKLAPGVFAKDIILAIIANIGAAGATLPSTVMRMRLGRRCQIVCVISTCATSEAPIPNANAPSAPWVEVWLSPQTMSRPGRVRPCSGPTTCTIPCRRSFKPNSLIRCLVAFSSIWRTMRAISGLPISSRGARVGT